MYSPGPICKIHHQSFDQFFSTEVRKIQHMFFHCSNSSFPLINSDEIGCLFFYVVYFNGFIDFNDFNDFRFYFFAHDCLLSFHALMLTIVIIRTIFSDPVLLRLSFCIIIYLLLSKSLSSFH